jgi:hypothetical protein
MTLLFKLLPGIDHIDGRSIVAKVLPWTAASRIHERLGLGFDDVLKTPTTEDQAMICERRALSRIDALGAIRRA